MTIACLAWGSLVWNPGELSIEGDWNTDGPSVRVEYLRQSKDGRLTLVLDSSAAAVPALWAKMRDADLPSSIDSLARREGIGPRSTSKFIGRWSIGEPEPELIGGLADWAEVHSIEHAVWTALPPLFDGQLFTATEEQALNYIRGLTGDVKESAEQYIRRTPHQVRTRYRQTFEESLNWTPQVAN